MIKGSKIKLGFNELCGNSFTEEISLNFGLTKNQYCIIMMYANTRFRRFVYKKVDFIHVDFTNYVVTLEDVHNYSHRKYENYIQAWSDAHKQSALISSSIDPEMETITLCESDIMRIYYNTKRYELTVFYLHPYNKHIVGLIKIFPFKIKPK